MAQGRSQAEILERLGCNQATVHLAKAEGQAGDALGEMMGEAAA